MIKNKKTLLIISLLLITCILLIILSIKNRLQKPTIPVPTSSPVIFISPSPSIDWFTSGPKPGTTVETISPSDQAFIDQQSLVGKLLDKIPYKGNLFELNFNYSTYQWTLILNKDQIAAGNQEFDNFLRTNGIQDRSWLKKLVIISK